MQVRLTNIFCLPPWVHYEHLTEETGGKSRILTELPSETRSIDRRRTPRSYRGNLPHQYFRLCDYHTLFHTLYVIGGLKSNPSSGKAFSVF